MEAVFTQSREDMGVARNLEKRLEGLMEGFFTKLFRSGLQPVEVGRRILREMAQGKTVSINRIYVPNEFHVYLGADDLMRFEQMESGLVADFSDLVIEEAKDHRWNLMGAPRINFLEAQGMGRGEYRVESSLTADPGTDVPRASTREPVESDPSATAAIPTDTASRLGLAARNPRLEVVDDEGAVRESISLTQSPITVGRLSSNDVVLTDSNVSRRHSELRRDGSRWLLVDLGSTNGTIVNGKLAKEHELKDGDRLSFGASELIFKTARGS